MSVVKYNSLKILVKIIIAVFIFQFYSCQYYNENSEVNFKANDNAASYEVNKSFYNDIEKLLMVELKVKNLGSQIIYFNNLDFDLIDKDENHYYDKYILHNKEIYNPLNYKVKILPGQTETIKISYTNISKSDASDKIFYWGEKHSKKVKLKPQIY